MCVLRPDLVRKDFATVTHVGELISRRFQSLTVWDVATDGVRIGVSSIARTLRHSRQPGMFSVDVSGEVIESCERLLAPGTVCSGHRHLHDDGFCA